MRFSLPAPPTSELAGWRRYSRLSRDAVRALAATLWLYVVAGWRRYSRLSRDSTNRSNCSHSRTAFAYGAAGLLPESGSNT
ncbi:hypothetical protein DE4576_01754 [Mycobacterium marinum]|nr:hypothetical protein DE4576_01754 [Mycobacterium marinum]